jgi:Na+/proline symporter
VGLLVTVAVCAPDLIASWSDARAQLPPSFFELDGGRGWGFALTTFLAFFLGETFAPGYATRYCIGKDVRQTRLGIAGVGVFLALVFPAILFFIALYARLHFPGIEPQHVLPMVLDRLNNAVVGGMMVGALLMAVMSSADSALNSATAVFVKDLFEHHLGWKGEARTLRLARICSACLGGSAIAVAAIWRDVIDLLLFTYHLWAPVVIVPVCVGVFSKVRSRAQTRNVLVTMLVSVASTMAYRLSSYAERFDPAVFGVAISLATYALLSVVARGWSRARGQAGS